MVIEEAVLDFILLPGSNENEMLLFSLFFNKVVQIFLVKSKSKVASPRSSTCGDTPSFKNDNTAQRQLFKYNFIVALFEIWGVSRYDGV